MAVKDQTEVPMQTDGQKGREKRLVDLSEYQVYFCKKEEVSEKQLKTTFELCPAVRISGKIKGAKRKPKKGKLNASRIELIAASPNLSEIGILKMLVNEQEAETCQYLIAEYSDIVKLRNSYEMLKIRIENVYNKRKPLKLKLEYLADEGAKA